MVKLSDCYFKKYRSWCGRCGAEAKHYGLSDRLIRMNGIKEGYWRMYRESGNHHHLPIRPIW